MKAAHREHLPEFLANLHPHAGKPYDFKYELGQENLYCSELVFHAWNKTTGQEMGKLTALGDLNWKPFQATIEKYNGGPMPPDREIISPIELSKAAQLEQVYNHGLDKWVKNTQDGQSSLSRADGRRWWRCAASAGAGWRW